MARTPRGLKERGKALWKHYDFEPGTPEGILALEACRSADLLDDMFSERAIEGLLDRVRVKVEDIVWEVDEDGEDAKRVIVEVKVDSLLAETRQQQGALRQMLLNLGLVTVQPKADDGGATGKAGQGGPPNPPASEKTKSVVDEFTKKRRERGA